MAKFMGEIMEFTLILPAVEDYIPPSMWNYQVFMRNRLPWPLLLECTEKSWLIVCFYNRKVKRIDYSALQAHLNQYSTRWIWGTISFVSMGSEWFNDDLKLGPLIMSSILQRSSFKLVSDTDLCFLLDVLYFSFLETVITHVHTHTCHILCISTR